jgi:predicted dehydrogenase
MLGHGNSPGMEKSWKLDPIQCGGGSLLDPCIHLLDLVLCLASGTVSVRGGCAWSGFWNTGIEEESHFILSDSKGVIYNIQSSLNRWKSTFSFSINGTDGYGVVDGRGKSYGPQSYKTGKRWAWLEGVNQRDTELVVIDQDNVENSFFTETASILGVDLSESRSPFELYPCDEKDALKTMQLYDKCKNLLKSNTCI